MYKMLKDCRKLNLKLILNKLNIFLLKEGEVTGQLTSKY